MNEHTPAQLREQQLADICLLDNLCSKLNSVRATARERHKARMNSGVGNAAHDVETLAHEIGKIGSRILVAASEISAAEYEAAQRQAEIDHGPLIDTLRAIIAGPNVVVLRQREGAV